MTKFEAKTILTAATVYTVLRYAAAHFQPLDIQGWALDYGVQHEPRELLSAMYEVDDLEAAGDLDNQPAVLELLGVLLHKAYTVLLAD